MKRLLPICLLLLGLGSNALAAPKKVTLSVPGMYCAVCPVTVKKALGQVKGVIQIDVDYDRKAVTVTFDDAKAQVDDLTRATEAAGYPSKPLGHTMGPRK